METLTYSYDTQPSIIVSVFRSRSGSLKDLRSRFFPKQKRAKVHTDTQWQYRSSFEEDRADSSCDHNTNSIKRQLSFEVGSQMSQSSFELDMPAALISPPRRRLPTSKSSMELDSSATSPDYDSTSVLGRRASAFNLKGSRISLFSPSCKWHPSVFGLGRGSTPSQPQLLKLPIIATFLICAHLFHFFTIVIKIINFLIFSHLLFT